MSATAKCEGEDDDLPSLLRQFHVSGVLFVTAVKFV